MSAYNIGQYRYSKTAEYLSTIIDEVYPLNRHEYDENTQTKTKDLKITYNFKGLTTYYLKCAFNGFGRDIPQEFTIKLKTEDGKREQIIKTFSFTGTDYSNSIEVAFTPKTDFSKIVFELKRETLYDFSGKGPREMTFSQSTNVSLSSVANILGNTFLNIDSIFKLGVQGPADLIICINGEPIRLGPSGVFEVHKEDFTIYSVGFIVKPTISKTVNFIMDYCY